MTEKERIEEQNRLLCGNVLNESWSKVEKYTDEITAALEKKELTEHDLSLIKIAAAAFIQRAMIEKADAIALFGVDLYSLSPCGQNSKEGCPCNRSVCVLSS